MDSTHIKTPSYLQFYWLMGVITSTVPVQWVITEFMVIHKIARVEVESALASCNSGPRERAVRPQVVTGSDLSQGPWSLLCSAKVKSARLKSGRTCWPTKAERTRTTREVFVRIDCLSACFQPSAILVWRLNC
jgi:hypothetical protein